MKKEEANDVVQYLLPQLNTVGIPTPNCKIDVTTHKTVLERGDVWISTKPQTDRTFEENIVALIEAKHRNCNVGDKDWRDAMRHGAEKAGKQGLTYYAVTNCRSEVRFYNATNDEEVVLDGGVLTKFVSLEVLRKIQSQVSPETSRVFHKAGDRPPASRKQGFGLPSRPWLTSTAPRD